MKNTIQKSVLFTNLIALVFVLCGAQLLHAQDDATLINITNLEQLDAMRYDLGGDGVADDVSDEAAYQVAFSGLATVSYKGYELMVNLDFEVASSYASSTINMDWTTGSGWEPIGIKNNEFTAIFEGNGHTISNLFIDRSSTSYVGLFGYVSGRTAELRNLGIVDVEVTGLDTVGGLVGENQTGTVSGSYATGAVTGDESVGGLVGINDEGTVSGSYATGTVMGDESVGGLVGENSGDISDSYATGAMTDGNIVGGLVGINDEGTVSNSYATGAVTGDESVGGLVGINDGESTISGSYATGAVTGSGNRVGGLVGENSGDISGSHATGTVTGLDIVGGLVGFNSGDISDSYATGAVTGSGNRVGGLVGENSGDISGSHATGTVTGLDIVGGLVGFNSGDISDSYATGAVTGSGNRVGGLVGESSGGGTVSGSYATGAVTGLDIVGGLVGFNSEDISDSYATGAVTGTRRVGGLVGFNSKDISDSYATGTVTGNSDVGSLVGFNNQVGGLVGHNFKGTVSGSYATGSVTGLSDVGGLVGLNEEGTISGSYATGSVTGLSDVGGLVGINLGDMVSSYATGAVAGLSEVGGLVGLNEEGTVSGSYATGAVTGNNNVGGLVGKNFNGTVTASYYNAQTTGQSDIGKGESKTTSELLVPTGYVGIYQTWNDGLDGVTDYWDFGTNEQYPVLKLDVDGNGTMGDVDDLRLQRLPKLSIVPFSLDFGDVSTASTTSNTMTYDLTGANLTEDVTLTIGGTNADLFSVDMTTILPSSGVISTTTVTVTFTPTTVGGPFTAMITHSGGGLTTPLVVSLTGTGVPPPPPVLGFATRAISNLRLSPNPVTRLLYVQGYGLGDMTVTVRSIAGKVHGSYTIRNAGKVPFSGLPSGMYIVQIVSQTGIVTKQVIKSSGL